MGRAPCCDKANVKKGPWSPEEDAKLKSYIDQHGTGGNWIALPQKIGLKRCGKSCRLRWLNYLRPNIKHGGFSEEEDKIILSLYVSIGSRWSIIAAQLPGRTDNDIKNYWNTRLKKKLLGKQRKNQHARRGIDLIKQEGNSIGNSTIPPSSSNVINNFNQTPYWSQLSMANTILSPNYLTQVELNHGSINDQTSLRKLLMKVEESCYGGNNNLCLDEQFISQYSNTYPNIPLISSLHQPNYDGNIISSLAFEGILSTSSSTSTCQITNPSHFSTHQGVGEEMGVLEGQDMTFPPEIEELMSSKPCQRMDELDFLYGDYNENSNLVNNNDGSTSDTTTCGESSGWCEMNSLVSIPNLDYNCNELVHGIVDECQIEEKSRYSSGL